MLKCVLHREKDKFFVACLRPKKNFPSGISRLSRAATAKKSGPCNLRVMGKNRVLLNFIYVCLLVPYYMISEVLLLEYLIVNLRLWLFFISQKPHPIIVLLYIERILSFSLRHKMHVFKVCSNSFFISSGSLSFFSFTWLHKQLLCHLRRPFCVLWVHVFNYFFDDLQRSKPEVMFFLLHWRLATQSARTWHDLTFGNIHRGHTWHDCPCPRRWFRKFTIRFRPIRKEIVSSMYNNWVKRSFYLLGLSTRFTD